MDRELEYLKVLRLLSDAAEFGYIEMVRFLLDNGLDPSQSQYLMLKSSAQNGHFDIFQLFVERRLYDRYNLVIARELATSGGHLNILKFLSNSGLTFQRSEIKRAAEGGHIEVVRYLLSHPENQDEKNAALSAASKNGYPEIVRLLLKSGASPKNFYPGLSFTLLRQSTRDPNTSQILHLLIEAGLPLTGDSRLYKAFFLKLKGTRIKSE
jgi:ankyrin repeat protein